MNNRTLRDIITSVVASTAACVTMLMLQPIFAEDRQFATEQERLNYIKAANITPIAEAMPTQIPLPVEKRPYKAIVCDVQHLEHNLNALFDLKYEIIDIYPVQMPSAINGNAHLDNAGFGDYDATFTINCKSLKYQFVVVARFNE